VPTPHRENSRVSYSAQQCLDRATECDRKALEAKDRDAKTTFTEYISLTLDSLTDAAM